jgi:hypothetical protein
MLPAGTMKYIFLNKVSDLLSRDENLMKYRLCMSTTSRPLTATSLSERPYDDRIIRYFGADLRAWNEAIVVPTEPQLAV